ncbi:MAG TPA: helix-turn-helix domain-containing protein [Candidatus Micrarchaeaceae archaeon]|nr:helix-turn-helix domain-containing protein [Candidatus Micrarchaeaceae archaeon]
MESLLLRVDEVAQLMNLGRTRTFELIASGELPVVRIGRAVRVPRNELERWLRSRTTGGFTGEVESGAPVDRVSA